MKATCLKLNAITTAQELQPRVELDDSHIEDLKRDLSEGAEFPPVVVFHDGTTYWLADGFHRFMAHQKAGRSEILAAIRKGGKRDAQLHAVGSNATHGKRRTNADKRRAVGTLLLDAEWGGWSDREIAKKCLVSQPLVSDVRRELTESGFQFPATRKCSDGREMDVSQIGNARGQDPQLAEKSPEDAHPTETSQVDDAELAGEDPFNTPGSSAPIADSQPGDAAESDELQPEAKPEGGTARATQEVAPAGRDESPAERPETPSPEIDEGIPTLKARIAELEAHLREKDLRISELEKRVQELQKDNASWVLEFENLDEMDRRRCKAHWTEPKPSRRPLLSL